MTIAEGRKWVHASDKHVMARLRADLGRALSLATDLIATTASARAVVNMKFFIE